MKVKKYLAPTMREALDKMKSDMGTGAVILGSRKVSRGGVLDFLGREMFEVTATTEENIMSDTGKKAAAGAVPGSGSRVSVVVDDKGPLAGAAAVGDFPGLVKARMEKMKPGQQTAVLGKNILSAPQGAAVDPGTVHLLKRELREIKSAMGDMAEQIRYQRMPALPPVLKDIYRKLLDNELEENLCLDMIQSLYARFSENRYSDREVVEKHLMKAVSSMLKVARPTPVREKGPLVIAFAGPTGVGKTTCLAKLATNERFYGGSRVAMITADTYRVASTQQLGTFSEISGIPLEVVHSPRDMKKAIAGHRDKEVIMIDTQGTSQFNARLLRELKAMLEAAEPDEIQLVLSAVAKPKDLVQSIKGFRMGKNIRLLMTKFDETLTFGSIVSVVHRAGVPLSFISFGQEVPEDIEAANAGKLARLVVRNIF
ncbi:MAG: flagellar biosynthesis protein FlhF [Gemmatimonadota bacterium]|nr:flagellar biosynthesis protein FlhF [Gemmatimonadota bacterium]